MLLVCLECVDRGHAKYEHVNEHFSWKLSVKAVSKYGPQYDGADQGNVRHLMTISIVRLVSILLIIVVLLFLATFERI